MLRRFIDITPRPATEDHPHWNAAAGKPAKPARPARPARSDDRDQEQQQD